MTNAIFNMPTVPSYSESSSKVQYSSWEGEKEFQLLMHVPWWHMEGWEVEVELHPVLTLALDARWAVSFKP